MNKLTNETLVSQSDLLPRFLRLAIANVVSSVIVPLASTLSVLFLGHLPEIHHLAGATLAGSLINNLYMVLGFLRTSTTGVTSQAVGRDDREAVLLVVLRNGIIAIVLGAAIVLLQYPLRYLGFALYTVTPEVKASAIAYFHAQIWAAPAVLLNYVLNGWFLGQEQNGLILLLSLAGNAANIALDYLLIVQWGWESTGAGLSGCISQYLTLLVGLIFFYKQINWEEVRCVSGKIWATSALKSTMVLNSNIFVTYLLILVAFIIFDYQSSSMGTIVYTENALLIQIYTLTGYVIGGIGCCTETLTGNFKGKGATNLLVPLLGIAVGSSLLVGLSFTGACVLFPQTVFGLLTNHTEVTENIGVYVSWLVPVLGFGSIAWMLEGYFSGLAEGHTLRNVSLVAIVLGFAPIAFVAWQFHSNHLLWLALSLLYAIRMVALTLQLPRTLGSDIEDGIALDISKI
ncbi:MAG: guanitoxin biosynthesis MATE family efflux transporter GntT [Rhizonema sp. PD37]|nr:guanitoxin biosynthesis MATE family efflux transporter GntT [Rhizonema sp. PD37]